MLSKPASRSARGISQQSRQCLLHPSRIVSIARQFSNTPYAHDDIHSSPSSQQLQPRWSYTPERMKAPFSPHPPKDPSKAFESNDDPVILDAMYKKLFGKGGENLLTDEIKWLAVTHKSFDQGRRGFNDRLALLGRRILQLQTTLAIVRDPQGSRGISDPFGRKAFSHPALEGLANLDAISTDTVLAKERLSRISKSYGIDRVTRWKPRLPDRLDSSGADVVFTTSLLAILGAVSLQRGGERANEMARDKILKPLGIS